jgi:hypothetical protein
MLLRNISEPGAAVAWWRGRVIFFLVRLSGGAGRVWVVGEGDAHGCATNAVTKAGRMMVRFMASPYLEVTYILDTI